MKIAISQPTYLPWTGYFDLIDQVDIFVFLDNVQFEKQSWQQRNRIKTPSGLQWLTVPVVFRGRFGQPIHDVEIRDPNFHRNHVRALELNYRRAPHFDKYFDRLNFLLTNSGPRLAEMNISLIQWLLDELELSTKILRASDLEQTGRQAELLANICSSLGATEYVSPVGATVYLLERLEIFAGKGIDVSFQHFKHPVYQQLFPPFCSHASIVDLLMNEGDRSLSILRSGRRAPLAPHEITRTMPAETPLYP